MVPKEGAAHASLSIYFLRIPRVKLLLCNGLRGLYTLLVVAIQVVGPREANREETHRREKTTLRRYKPHSELFLVFRKPEDQVQGCRKVGRSRELM